MSETNGSRRVCVIGLGTMGSALAEALLAKNHQITVWNRTASKCEALAAAGASAAESLPEAVAEAQFVVVCVRDHEASASLLLSGEVARALKGKLLVQLSTVSSEESRALASWSEENGIAYLDGSILGYREDVLNDNCPIVYSGSKAAFEANKSVLAAMGGNPRFLSETAGSVPVFDKSLYSFHWGSLFAFFHGAAMCHAAGFPVELYTELALRGEDGTRVKRRYGQMIAERAYEPEPLDLDVMCYAHVTRLSAEFGIDTAFPELVAGYIDRAAADRRQSLGAIAELMMEKGQRAG